MKILGNRYGRRWRAAALVSVAAVWIAGAAIHKTLQAKAQKTLQAKVEAAEPLSAYAPQGALMAVESPDFGTLLAAWTSSDEEKAWMRSDSYAEFSRSRLFSRLGEAQNEFAASAGLDPDAAFLDQVAGKESLFAWYDIGKLEFLYITRMKPGEAANSPLMKLVSKFQMRKAGADSFYIRDANAQPDGGGPSSDGGADQAAQPETSGSTRTVAFAVHGDLLLLGTREDLIANALLLAQHQGDATLRSEPWYVAAVGAAGAEAGNGGKGSGPPDLRMTLNLAKIVPSPYFRSYWVQKNVSEMKQYSAAVSDLYRTEGEFREERVLIPKSPDAAMAAGDLGQLLKYVPKDSGVYRATVMPETGAVIDELDQRLISRGASTYRDVRVAPVADLSDSSAGSSSDLDTRIDEQPVPALPMERALDGLRRIIDAARPAAMLVYTTGAVKAGRALPAADAIFAPIHSAVVLSASAAGDTSTAWDTNVVQSAATAALQARLTVGGAGLKWMARQQDGEVWMELSGLQPLAVAVHGGDLILASDSATLLSVLGARRSGPAEDQYTNVDKVAGFDHSAERERFRRMSVLLDRNHAAGAGGSPDAPEFISGNVGSLSDAFKSLASETFMEAPMPDHSVRQRVVYRWRP